MADENIPAERAIVTRDEAKVAGLKRFFSGEPCKYGHISERFVSRACVECVMHRTNARRGGDPEEARSWARKYKKRLRAENPEMARAMDRERYRKNPSRSRAAKQKWLLDNAERKRAADAEWRRKNADLMAKNGSAWYENNKDRMKELHRLWREANPDAKRANSSLYRARKRSAEGHYAADDISSLMGLQKSKCAHPWCKKSLKSGFHVDHIIALASGGSNWPKNIQLLCPRCNCSKKASHPADFARRHGMLI